VQLSFKRRRVPSSAKSTTLDQLRPGDHAQIERLDLPEEVALRLMELGFLPGHAIVPAGSAPGGEPRVYRIDGSEVALRRETASRMHVSILRPAEGT
jgi:ferrous iron transport protein A